MKKQVLSIEEMQTLINKGVDVSGASHFYRWGEVYANSCEYEKIDVDIPAFDLQDILEILPLNILIDGETYVLLIHKGGCFYANVTDYNENIITFNSGDIMKDIYDMLLWCIENNHIKTSKQ